MSDSLEKLNRFLIKHNVSESADVLTADASTRDYFRISWKGESAIACVYQESFKQTESTYIDVTDLFLSAKLPVAEIYHVDEDLGIIIQQDFGDTILRDVLLQADSDKRDRLMYAAIDLIAAIQSATDLAFERNSVASQLKFDTDKLNWELNFFKEHYFNTFKNEPLEPSLDKALSSELLQLATELDKRAKVLCHRDFHVANLMVKDGDLKIIDHQDARIGSITYDLVSLLLDRLTEMPNPLYLENKN